MAQPKIVKGGYIDILVGDGATPEVFTKLCGLNTKSFTIQKNTSDVFVPDCDDPEDIPVRFLNVTGLQWDLSGSGLYNRAQGPLIRTLASDSASRNMRFVMSEPGTDPVDDGYYAGKALVTNVQFGGPTGAEYATVDLTLASEGAWDWVEAA